jgi:multidrug efflux pump subunit AcrB
MTLTLAAVLCAAGLHDRAHRALFTEFALTLAGAVIVSGLRGADAHADDVLAAAATTRRTASSASWSAAGARRRPRYRGALRWVLGSAGWRCW